MGNGMAATGHFHFRDLEMTPYMTTYVKGHCGF